MQQISLLHLSAWEFLILINLVEREIINTTDSFFDSTAKRQENIEKRNSLSLLKNKLQATSLGPKPFEIEVKI